MKFTCESCSAQYMISDEKVGPSGVKVRCKKCGNVIVVRRGQPAPAAAPEAAAQPSSASGANGSKHPAASAGAPAGGGLDAELGQAFDHAFGDAPAGAPAPAGAAGDMASTQLMGSEDAAKVFAEKAPSPTATEWYVAIGQAQVGPLPLPEVKKKWEGGDVGPDSLVWRPGMADWAPLTTVSELAGYLAPVPRASAQPARAAEPRSSEPAGRAEPHGSGTPAPEPSWKPIGASALAALANEEIASRSAPEPKPAPRPAQGGVKSLVDALPDGGGVDPTGALPLNIKALEPSTERKLERRSSVARGAAEARHRRSTARGLFVGLALGAVVVAGAVVGYPLVKQRLMPPPPVAAAPAQRAPAVPLPPPPVPTAPAAVETPAATPAAAAAPPAATPPAATAATPAAASAEAAPKDAAASSERQATTGKRERSSRREARKEASRTVAAAPPQPPAAAPAPTPTPTPPPAAAPAPARKKGDLLDFESNDAALDAALGGGGSSPGRSVYVPPARAGGGALPEKVSPGDINAAVAQRIEPLRRCVAEQKAREPDATGTLKMRWLIQGDGSVRDVKCITPEYAQGAFAQCIGGVVKTIRFPRSATTGQEVTFPFNF